MRRLRWIIILSVWSLVGMVLTNHFLSASAPAPPEHQVQPATRLPAIANPDAPQSELHGAVLVEQTTTSPAWKVMADQAALYDNTQTAIAQGVQAQLIQDRETVVSLKADEGNVSQANGDISVQGRVNVQHRDGYTIRTDALDWQASSRTLQTDQPVRIDGPSMQITGTGLRSEVDEHQFSLQRDVKASFQLRPGPLRSDQPQTDAKE